MAAKKQVVSKETNQITDVVEETVAPVAGTEPKNGDAPVVQPGILTEKREPGTIIKTYLQNGLRYNRVVQDDGVTTLDMRA